MVAYFCGEPGLRAGAARIPTASGAAANSLTLAASDPSEPCPMAKHNYAFERRQRDLAKKRKQEEKRRRKTGTTDTAPDTAPKGEAGDTQSLPVPAKPADDTPAT